MAGRSGSTVLIRTGWRPSGSTPDRVSVGPLVGVGALGAGAVVVAAGWSAAGAGGSGWLRLQAARARLAMSRAVAMVRMGRMVVIPLWAPGLSMEPYAGIVAG